jgi:GntR family transcriptional regulator/MocR family aminotransferase
MAIPSESFVLIPGADGTLQQQIRTLVAEGIVSGRFRSGDRLPSSRGLATHLGISRITVTLAYADLVAQDYLTSRGRSGHFVSATAPRPSDLTAGRRPRRDQVDFDTLPLRRFSGTGMRNAPLR